MEGSAAMISVGFADFSVRVVICTAPRSGGVGGALLHGPGLSVHSFTFSLNVTCSVAAVSTLT